MIVLLSLLMGSARAANDLPFGEARTGHIAAGEMQSYQLQASAGDVIHIKLTTTSGNMWPGVIVYDPAGTEQKKDSTPPTCTFDVTAARSGQYTIIVNDGFNGQYTGDYRLTVQRIPDPVNARDLEMSALQVGSITDAGAFDTYAFAAGYNDTIRAKMTKTSGNLWPKISIYSPTGQLVVSEDSTVSYERDIRLPEAGTYTLIAEDGFNGAFTGQYSLMLLTIAKGPGGAAPATGPTAAPGPTTATGAPAGTETASPAQGGVSPPDAGALPWAWIGGAGLLIVIVGAITLVVLRRGKKQQPLAPPSARPMLDTPEQTGEARPRGTTHDVFISYSSDDKIIADAVCARLESKKIRCWIAPRDILPGTNYAEAILNAIDGAVILVLVFSSSANRSPHVMREVENAVSKGLPIITFRIDDTSPGPQIKYFIGPLHWLDAMTPPLEKHIERLAETVELNLAHSKKYEQPIAAVTPARQVNK